MNLIGQYIAAKFRKQAREYGYETAAKRLRKQGIPLDMALLILIYA